jgi:3-oxoacyl-[acyl-carrier protein] reductase
MTTHRDSAADLRGPDMFSLAGRRAIVCGATQGIGRATAEVFAECGATVTLLARRAEALEEVRASLTADGGRTHTSVVADFADPEAVVSAVAAHLADAGPAHILVNNTGGPPGGPIAHATADAFETAFRMHLVTNQRLAQTLVPGMQDAGYGRIINVISTSVKSPIPGLGVSNTIRGAVASWAKTLATELAPTGVTVNNVLPGFTDTARLQSLIATRAGAAGVPESQIAEQMRSSVPAGRFADPRETAAAVAFLASPAAAYVTGISIAVDGGRTNCL